MKLLIVLIALAGCAHKINHDETASATMGSSEQKDLSGTVLFKSTASGLMVEAHIMGLKPNSYHGLHIHQKGKCDGPGYESAEGHLNPQKHPHGSPGEKSHLGDLGNIISDADGHGKLNLLLTDVRPEDFKMIVGRSVVIHDEADDQKSQPAGKSGARIACGVINR
jgi:superoxide dismutase, Cu-Zn family